MDFKPGLILRQTLNPTLNQSVQFSLQVLRMSQEELSQLLLQKLEENPLLERDFEAESRIRTEEEDLFRPARHNSQEAADEAFLAYENEPEGVSYRTHLKEQLRMETLSPDLEALCEDLIDSLDERGYLADSLESLAEYENASMASLRQALQIVQNLEPAGTGARSLEECLLLQIERLKQKNACSPETALDAEHIIMQGLELLASGDTETLAEQQQLEKNRLDKAIKLIRMLQPIPAAGHYADEPTVYTMPDALIQYDDSGLTIRFYHAYPQVRVSSDYRKQLEGTLTKEARQFLNEKRQEAHTLLRSVTDREQTIERVLRAIAKRQQGYFIRRGTLKPMTMRDLAEDLELDVSTISRAIQSKYIVCNGTVIPVRVLFANGYPGADGETVSTFAIQKMIREIVSGENKNHPLSDEAIRSILLQKGLQISRRAVAKHRERAGLPSSRERRNPMG